MTRSELFCSLALLVALLITCVALFAMLLANSFLLGVLLKALFFRLTA